MKICLINNLYKPYNRGGAERVVELIAAGLQEAGHNVFIISTKPITQKHLPRQLVKAGKNTCLANSSRRAKTPAYAKDSEGGRKHKIYYISALYYNLAVLPKFLRLFWHLGDMFDVGSYFKVISILKKEKPDIVMTHNLKGIGYLIPKAIKHLGIKHIHTLHDIQLLHPSGLMIHNKEKKVDSNLSKMYADACCRLFGSPNAVTSPSEWLMKMHADKGFFKFSKNAILPNPILTPSPRYSSGEAGQPPLLIRRGGERGEVFRFLYVGQIEEHKGILFLIKIFKMLCEDLEDANCELVIAGDGSKLKQAKKLAGNDGRVKFLGVVDNKDLIMMMQECNVLAVPSLCYENSPTVIYEALSVGLPVIASRIGGITELIHKTSGVLFKPGNGGDLMHQMKWALKHPQELQKIAKTGKEKVKQFDLENYIERLLNLLK